MRDKGCGVGTKSFLAYPEKNTKTGKYEEITPLCAFLYVPVHVPMITEPDIGDPPMQIYSAVHCKKTNRLFLSAPVPDRNIEPVPLPDSFSTGNQDWANRVRI